MSPTLQPRPPEYLYVDPATGETFEEFQPGRDDLVVIHHEDALPTIEEEKGRRFADWYTRQLARIEAEQETAKAAHKAKQRELRARLGSLEYLHRSTMEAITSEELKTAKNKSVLFEHGRAGYRKQTRTDVVDLPAAMAWAGEHAPDAIKYPDPELLVSKLPKNVEIPGIDRPTEDEFFVRVEGGAKK